MKLSSLAAAAAAVMTIGMAATPASAALVVSTKAGACQLGDINPSALHLLGLFRGEPDQRVQARRAGGGARPARLHVGQDYYSDCVQALRTLGGADTDFSQLVTGISYIAIHWGAALSPTRSRRAGPRRSTRSTRGAGLDIIDLVRGSSGNAYLYSVTPPAACQGLTCGGGGIPEPDLGHDDPGVRRGRRDDPPAALRARLEPDAHNARAPAIKPGLFAVQAGRVAQAPRALLVLGLAHDHAHPGADRGADRGPPTTRPATAPVAARCSTLWPQAARGSARQAAARNRMVLRTRVSTRFVSRPSWRSTISPSLTPGPSTDQALAKD